MDSLRPRRRAARLHVAPRVRLNGLAALGGKLAALGGKLAADGAVRLAGRAAVGLGAAACLSVAGVQTGLFAARSTPAQAASSATFPPGANGTAAPGTPANGTAAPSSDPDATLHGASAADLADAWPERLSETGLYVAGDTRVVDARNLPYAPQYPLWTDGASKRRWLRLPEGGRIDASDPDHFEFPAGTRFYKEFSFGQRTETRVIELTPGGARYATYVWSADGADATLAPERGIRNLRVSAPAGTHDVPSQLDCRACHEGRRGVVLGFDALQLSGDRDPFAPHAEPSAEADLDLAELVRRDLIEHLPAELLATPPRIAAPTPRERAARGYLYGNCAHCHNAEGPLAPLGLDFDAAVATGAAAPRSPVGQASRFPLPGAAASLRIAAGDPEHSVVAWRMRSLAPIARMPPLGTRHVDSEGLQLIEGWIASLPASDRP